MVASLLKFDAAPGLATLILLAAVAAAIIIYSREVASRRNAAGWLRRLVEEAEDESALGGLISDIDYRIQADAKGDARRHVAVAWLKYRETLVPHYEDDAVVLRNSVRPSIFFNPDELHFGAGGWRTGPGLFVSVGLLLIVLGLIAALSSMDMNDGENIQKSLKDAADPKRHSVFGHAQGQRSLMFAIWRWAGGAGRCEFPRCSGRRSPAPTRIRIRGKSSPRNARARCLGGRLDSRRSILDKNARVQSSWQSGVQYARHNEEHLGVEK